MPEYRVGRPPRLLYRSPVIEHAVACESCGAILPVSQSQTVGTNPALMTWLCRDCWRAAQGMPKLWSTP